MMNQESGVRSRELGVGKSPLHPFTPSPVHSKFPLRRGFTLLEVILALGLTAVVLSLVGTAVNSTLRTVESGRRRTEREQLARAIMHRIADDLRSVVRYEPFDDSGLNSDIGGGLGAITGAGSTGGSTGGTSNQTSGSTNQNSGNSTTGGSSSNSASSQSSSGQTESGETSEEETVTTPVAGIYGNQNEVTVDITRIPRLDEYLYADGVNAPLQRGDVRTVTYYLGGAGAQGAAGAAVTTAMSSTSSMNAAGGLARTEVDRAVSLSQMQTGTASGTQSGVILASEVTSVQFRYFDGTMWLTEWDSTAMNGIPRAVEISLTFCDEVGKSQSSGEANSVAAGTGSMVNDPDNYYRMVVHLPAGIPLPAAPPIATEETTQDSTSGTPASSGTTGGNTQNGGQQ